MVERIVRRLGSTPAQRGSLGNNSCPDVFELENGDFAVIGARTPDLVLPEDASVGPDETIVTIPRRVLLDAARDLRGS